MELRAKCAGGRWIQPPEPYRVKIKRFCFSSDISPLYSTAVLHKTTQLYISFVYRILYVLKLNFFLQFSIISITINDIFLSLPKKITCKALKNYWESDPEGKARGIRVHNTDGRDLDPVRTFLVSGYKD